MSPDNSSWASGSSGSAEHVDVVIVGAGFAGVAMLYRMRQQGFRTRVIESAGGPGGVWYWNRYPGARCDVESMDYSYSFDPELEQDWSWSETFASQPEILAYINHVVDRYGMRDDITFDTSVRRAEWSDDEHTWSVTTDQGETLTTTYLVMATGTLSVAKFPQFEGVDQFQGNVFHTGQWPHEPVSFSGQRVGVIGVGSSGTQMVGPVSDQADELFVFQRTPNFCIPGTNQPMDKEYERSVKENYRARRDFTRQTASGLNRDMNRISALSVTDEERTAWYEEAWQTAGFGFVLSYNDLLLSDEANQTAVDFINGKIREIVKDPQVAALLTPSDYPYGAKRPCVDSRYYDCFNRENVTLVDIKGSPIQRVTETGIQTVDAHYELDSIVFATGYDALTGALAKIEFVGRNGVTLAEKWDGGPRTYLGISTEGFPNLFMVAGPGSPSVLTNVMASIEQHVEWLADLFVHARETGVLAIEAELDAEDAWVDHVNELANATLYPKANSWYLSPEVPGRTRVFMPYSGGLRAYRRKCAEVQGGGYAGFSLVRRAEVPACS